MVRSGSVLDPHPFNFYSFACCIHPLASLKQGAKFDPDLIALFVEAHTVTEYMNLNPFIKIHTPSAAAKAQEIAVVLEEYVHHDDDKPLPEVVTNWAIDRLHKYVQEFETILSDELSKLPIFVLEDEMIGNFSINKLLRGASNGYPQKTRDRLTQACRDEIDESGKCLVYERSTAAGFHILRSVEVTIRQDLLAIPGFVMPENRQNWGEYLKLLKENGAVK